jgi:hypothetical protein
MKGNYPTKYWREHRQDGYAATTKYKKNNPEYITWLSMLWRCKNKKGADYRNYGSRGIKVKYVNFYAFLSDVGCHPGIGYSIDRINNDGHYEPGNCRWATLIQQRENKRICFR